MTLINNAKWGMVKGRIEQIGLRNGLDRRFVPRWAIQSLKVLACISFTNLNFLLSESYFGQYKYFLQARY